jgi:hypothetical protein
MKGIKEFLEGVILQFALGRTSVEVDLGLLQGFVVPRLFGSIYAELVDWHFHISNCA